MDCADESHRLLSGLSGKNQAAVLRLVGALAPWNTGHTAPLRVSLGVSPTEVNTFSTPPAVFPSGDSSAAAWR